jgi:hypothetical protein
MVLTYIAEFRASCFPTKTPSRAVSKLPLSCKPSSSGGSVTPQIPKPSLSVVLTSIILQASRPSSFVPIVTAPLVEIPSYEQIFCPPPPMYQEQGKLYGKEVLRKVFFS